MTRAKTASRMLSRFLLAAFVCAAALGVAPQHVIAAGEANEWYAIDVALYDLEPGLTPTLVITALLKQEIALPVEVELSIPKGAAVTWAGEILGGDPSLDPMVAVSVEPGGGYDVARFALSESPRVQLELSVPESFITDAPGERRVDMIWVAAGDVDRARVSVSLPQSFHMQDASPDPRVDFRPSDTLYSVETSPVVAGTVLEFHGDLAEGPDPGLAELMAAAPAVEATQAASDETTQAQADPSAEESGGSLGVWPIVSILALLLVGAAAALWRQMRR